MPRTPSDLFWDGLLASNANTCEGIPSSDSAPTLSSHATASKYASASRLQACACLSNIMQLGCRLIAW